MLHACLRSDLGGGPIAGVGVPHRQRDVGARAGQRPGGLRGAAADYAIRSLAEGLLIRR